MRRFWSRRRRTLALALATALVTFTLLFLAAILRADEAPLPAAAKAGLLALALFLTWVLLAALAPLDK